MLTYGWSSFAATWRNLMECQGNRDWLEVQ